MNDVIGGNLAAGGTASQATCGLGTGFTGNNNDWFEVTTSQAGYLRLELESIPFSCDWDLYVYDASLALKFFDNTNDCMETATSPSILPAGTYLIKVRRADINPASGNGQGFLRVKLLECMSATDCKGTDGTYNTYCPKDSIIPNYILPSCNPLLNECQCATECTTRTECATNFCCTGESPGPNEISGVCVQKSAIRNPWLCT